MRADDHLFASNPFPLRLCFPELMTPLPKGHIGFTFIHGTLIRSAARRVNILNSLGSARVSSQDARPVCGPSGISICTRFQLPSLASNCLG